MVQCLHVPPKRLLEACECLKRRSAYVRTAASDILDFLHERDDCLAIVYPQFRLRVCQLADLCIRMRALHDHILDYTGDLEEDALRLIALSQHTDPEAQASRFGSLDESNPSAPVDRDGIAGTKE